MCRFYSSYHCIVADLKNAVVLHDEIAISHPTPFWLVRRTKFNNNNYYNNNRPSNNNINI
jgi:hypothetical protein